MDIDFSAGKIRNFCVACNRADTKIKVRIVFLKDGPEPFRKHFKNNKYYYGHKGIKKWKAIIV